jgi:hypothetical protein
VDPLELPANVEFGAVETDSVPGQANDLTLPQAENKDQNVCGIQRAR